MQTINVYYEDYIQLQHFIDDNHELLFDNSALLVQAFCGICNAPFLQEMALQISGLLPHAQIIGTTTSGEIMDGNVSGRKIVLSFSVFSHSRVRTVCMLKNDKSDYQVGREVAKALAADTAKVLIVFATGLTVNAWEMLSGVQSVCGDLPVAGGNAGDNFTHVQGFVFAQGKVTDSGVAGAVIESDRLTVHRHCHLGWQPIGKEMTITEADKQRVYTIDNIPAYQIYRKYLGLEEDARIMNVIEFPLLTSKYGTKLARIPLVRYPDDSLGFVAAVEVGEKVQFSFGHIDIILQELAAMLESVRRHSVQSVFIYSCACRRGFLKELTAIETMPFQNIAPTAGFFTNGEFFNSQNVNHLLNATMTVVALSEFEEGVPGVSGKTSDAMLNLPRYTDRDVDVMRALTCLVNTVTKELAERTTELERVNQVLQYASDHDSLTGLYNRSFLEQRLQALEENQVDTSIGIIICDVDGLKHINDVQGHLAGDNLLCSAADVIKNVFSAGNVAARIGGDEFAILLTAVTRQDIEQYRERFCRAVAAHNSDNPDVRLSISFGYSFCENGRADAKLLFKEADNNMYRDKRKQDQKQLE